MADSPTAEASQVETSPSPPAGTQTAPAAAPSQSVDELPEWAKKELRDLRKENAARRTAEKAARDAEATELQRATQERDDLLQRFNETSGQLRDYRARDLLRSAGAIHPDLLTSRLSDHALSGDEKLQAKEIDALKKAYPGLFKIGTADGASGRTAPAPTNGGSLNDALRRKLSGS